MSELGEVIKGGDVNEIRDYAERLREGMKFVGYDKNMANEAIADLVSEYGIELRTSPNKILDKMKQKVDEANGSVSKAISRLNIS